MDKTKKIFVWIFIIVVVSLSVYGGFYIAQMSQEGSSEMPAGYKRDMSKNIPDVMPPGLIIQSEIKQVIESFSVNQEDGKTQYTFRYISNKSYTENVDYYSAKFSRGYEGWNMVRMSGNKTNLYSMDLIKYLGEVKGNMVLLITRAVNGDIVVDISITQ